MPEDAILHAMYKGLWESLLFLRPALHKDGLIFPWLNVSADCASALSSNL